MGVAAPGGSCCIRDVSEVFTLMRVFIHGCNCPHDRIRGSSQGYSAAPPACGDGDVPLRQLPRRRCMHRLHAGLLLRRPIPHPVPAKHLREFCRCGSLQGVPAALLCWRGFSEHFRLSMSRGPLMRPLAPRVQAARG